MQISAFGDPSALVPVELPDPSPGEGQVLLEVRAADCNFFDTLIVRGMYQVKPTLPFAPGGAAAGVVKSVGAGVTRFAPGDRVLCWLDWGGYATHALAREEDTYEIPAAMSFEHAAAFGLVYQTSYFGLVDRGSLRAGETLLVHSAAGGVGLAAVQIGRALGARVLGTAGGPAKCAFAVEQGAHACFDVSDPGWVAKVNEATGGRGADVIYDPIGGDVFDQSTKCIAFGGRLLVVGFAGGRIPTIQANRVLLKNIAVVGLHWGNYRKHQPDRVRAVMEALFALWTRGELRPQVTATRPLADAAQVLADFEARRIRGKVVLVP